MFVERCIMKLLSLFPFLCLFFSCVSNSGYSQKELEVEIIAHKIVKLRKFKQLEQAEFKDLSAVPAEPDYSKGIKPFPGLGMAGVPVLDQGQFGTCMTFSSTAALDALVQQGDFISQQCSLELDLGLGNDYWDGANMPNEIIDPLAQYGVVSQANCPDAYGSSQSSTIDVATYKSLVDPSASQIVSSVNYSYSPSIDLAKLKTAIGAGHRVLIGFRVNSSYAEAVRGFNVVADDVTYQGGLWACQQGKSKNYCANSKAGHESLVIGFDDAQQLIRIRNSWNTVVGLNGDYFMSYKYLSSMGIDMTEIW